MNRYLLFDSGCSRCTNLARSIERESGKKLIARSLRDPDISRILDREHPGWDWEPMLLEEENDKVRIYSGTSMSLRLITVLGPIQAWKVAKLVWATSRTSKVSENTQVAVYSGRRDFLKRSGALLIGVALLGLKPSRLLAEKPPPQAPVLLPEDQGKALELVKTSAEYASLPGRLVSLEPNSVWREEEYIFVAYDLKDTEQMIEPEDGRITFHDAVIFIVSDESVAHVVTLSPDTQKMRVRVTDLRNPDEAPRYELMSRQAVAQVISVQAAAGEAKARLQDESVIPQGDLECHSVCVEPTYVPGRMDHGCLGTCSAACMYLPGRRRLVCQGVCRAACWIPGYEWCNRWEWRCGTW